MFLCEYECASGHRTEYYAKSSSEKPRKIVCPTCSELDPKSFDPGRVYQQFVTWVQNHKLTITDRGYEINYFPSDEELATGYETVKDDGTIYIRLYLFYIWLAEPAISAAGLELINYKNKDFDTRQKERLTKRADDHNNLPDTKELIRHNAEKQLRKCGFIP